MSNKTKKHTECKVSIMTKSGVKKRVLKFINHRMNTSKLLLVGPKGGVSYKPHNSKTRRYVSKACKQTKCSDTFWDEVKRQANIRITKNAKKAGANKKRKH